jgi:hypothetical protein
MESPPDGMRFDPIFDRRLSKISLPLMNSTLIYRRLHLPTQKRTIAHILIYIIRIIYSDICHKNLMTVALQSRHENLKIWQLPPPIAPELPGRQEVYTSQLSRTIGCAG